MDELFTSRFVATHTDHRTVDDFFAASPWDAMGRAADRHWLVTHLD